MTNLLPIAPVSLSVDLKKYRIRIYKYTIHLLGDPPYIQILVNPQTRMVAVRSVDHSTPGDQSHKVSRRMMASDNSIEIYSRPFVSKLKEVAGRLDSGFTYKMTGAVFPSQNVALFEMKTLSKVNNQEDIHGY